MSDAMIQGKVDASAVLLRFRQMPPAVRAALVRETERQAFRLAAIAKRKVSGEVLKNRTGTLRRKIHGSVTDTDTVITGRIGLRLSYAHVHEYGFQGTVEVKEHLRHSARGLAYTARAHAMRMHMPERSFLRSTLREESATISHALKAALRLGLAGDVAP